MWNSMKYMKWTAYRIGSPLPPSWQLASAVASGISNIASLPLSVLLLPNMLYWQIYIFQMYIFYIYIHLIICGYHYFYIFIYIICMYLTYCVYWFKLLYVGFFFFLKKLRKEQRKTYICSLLCIPIYFIFPMLFIFPVDLSHDLVSVLPLLVDFLELVLQWTSASKEFS